MTVLVTWIESIINISWHQIVNFYMDFSDIAKIQDGCHNYENISMNQITKPHILNYPIFQFCLIQKQQLDV